MCRHRCRRAAGARRGRLAHPLDRRRRHRDRLRAGRRRSRRRRRLDQPIPAAGPQGEEERRLHARAVERRRDLRRRHADPGLRARRSARGRQDAQDHQRALRRGARPAFGRGHRRQGAAGCAAIGAEAEGEKRGERQVEADFKALADRTARSSGRCRPCSCSASRTGASMSPVRHQRRAHPAAGRGRERGRRVSGYAAARRGDRRAGARGDRRHAPQQRQRHPRRRAAVRDQGRAVDAGRRQPSASS